MDNVNYGTRYLKILSVDWLAFSIGIIGLFGSRFNSPMLGLLGLAVFGPPLLRELGVLKDCDEYTQNISRRAGFHTAVAVAILVFINHLVQNTIGSLPARDYMGDGSNWAYSMSEIRFIMVAVFLMSSLWQYWGGRLGSFRILLGVFVLSVMEIAAETMKQPEGVAWGKLLMILATILAFAFAARRRPRATGGLLLALCLIPLAKTLLVFQKGDNMAGWVYFFPMLTKWGIAAAIGMNLLWSRE